MTAPEKLVHLLDPIQGAGDPPLRLLDLFRHDYRQSLLERLADLEVLDDRLADVVFTPTRSWLDL